MTTLPRVQRKEVSPLADSQVQEMVSISGNDGYGFLLKIVMFTGLRLGEAISLAWDCVDFSKQRLTINKQLQKRPLADGGFTFTPLKNDKPRIIAPAKYVLDSLKRRPQLQIEDRLRAGSAWVGWRTPKEQQSALVFTNELGENLHPQTVCNHFKKLAAQIGAPNARIHDLRHTYAVLSLQNRDAVKTVQGNLGHATAAFTLDVYGHVSERMKMDSADWMQRYIENF